MAREINDRTGNYHDRQDVDLQQSVEDRLFTALGSRPIWPGYGFPAAWPQLSRSELQDAVTRAVDTDAFVDRMGFSYDGADLIVTIYTDARPDY